MRRVLSVALILAGCATQPTPTCSDAVRNGEESDVDCGGPACWPCELTRACVTSGDCQSALCVKKACAPGSCRDGRVSPGETDLDCGGASCRGCAPGQKWGAVGDCESGVCAGGSCAAPSCEDGRANGEESDLDCGGPCTP